MRIGVPKETAAGEKRVALVPEVVGRLKAKGLDVAVQSGAGEGALLPDQAFTDAGAQAVGEAEAWQADVVVKISPPTPQEIAKLAPGGVLIGFLAPLTSPQTTKALADARVTAEEAELVRAFSAALGLPLPPALAA